MRRACERDGADPADIVRRMSSQRFDLSKVDAVIHNSGTKEDLFREVVKVFKGLDGGKNKNNY